MAKKVMVAMSGGVDSSVAAALLKDEGYEVCGVTLKLFANEDIGIDSRTRTCCSLADVYDARDAARALGIKHYVFNFGTHFERDVIARFAESYASGKTPNPCIDCNRFIKFDKLLERAELLEQDYIATGHYARIVFDEKRGRYLLKKAKDRSKDQTYVLYAMTQKQLSKTLLPLGGMLKSQVRKLAEQRSLGNANKPDSQDICFVKDGDYAKFLETVMGVSSKPGHFIDRDGNILGEHKGLIHYTIGQRKGLNLSFGQRKYVIKKDVVNNTITLGDEGDLYSYSMIVGDVNLISIERLEGPVEAAVKTRYTQKEAPAVIAPYENGLVKVTFTKPQRAITPGQAAVFYDGDVVLGGGTIIE